MLMVNRALTLTQRHFMRMGKNHMNLINIITEGDVNLVHPVNMTIGAHIVLK